MPAGDRAADVRAPAVTQMPVAGRWDEHALARAKRDIAEKESVDDEAGWRRVERNELITGALNTIAGFACGRAITKIIDPDGTQSSVQTDQKGDTTEESVSIFFVVYTAMVLFAVGCGIYYIYGKVDAAEEERRRLEKKNKGRAQSAKLRTSSDQEDLLANELGSRVAHKFQTSVLTQVISKWSSTQMFTVAVLLHRLYDWTPSSPTAPDNAWNALYWTHIITVVLVILFYELPVRIAAHTASKVDLARVDRVVTVGANALAWLLAVFWMEALEISAAHKTMLPENLKNIHYYSSAYHGLPISLRVTVCITTFIATGFVLFLLQQVSKRANRDKRLCCRGRHAATDLYLKDLTARQQRKEPGSEIIDKELAMKKHFLGQHGLRLIDTCLQMLTNVSAISLQRMIMSLFTPANYDVADDFLLKGKSASDTVTGVVEIVDEVINGPTPEPVPEPLDGGSASGSWFEVAEENVTQAMSPLLAACQVALEHNNASYLDTVIHATRGGLSVDGHVVKQVDPEPEPLPEPEPEPEPVVLSEAEKISALKSTDWKDCFGETQKLTCSVMAQFSEPEGGPSWVLKREGCPNEAKLTVADGEEPRFGHTGSMTRGYCKEMPLFGDAMLLMAFAFICSMMALWVLVTLERRLRIRLGDVVDATAADIAQRGGIEPNPMDALGSRAPEEDEFAPMTGAGAGRDLPRSPSFGAANINLLVLQSRYEYHSILNLQGRSFCAWIVNKTWWDVTYDAMKNFNVADNYYAIAILLTGAAAICPLILYDDTLIKAVFCGKKGASLDPLKRGILHRSLSGSSEGGSQNGMRSYSGLDPAEEQGLRDGEEYKAAGGAGGAMQMVSIESMLSGPAAGEEGEEEVVAALRRRNGELEAQLAELQERMANPRHLV